MALRDIYNDIMRGGERPHPLLKYGWLLLLFPLAAYLRVPVDTSYLYNTDEAAMVNVASCASLADVLHCSLFELNPPLFYILLHCWMKISQDPNFVRCLPLLLGILTIPVYYLIGKRLGGEWCGLACATLVTLSHGCIFQSYVPRSYCLEVLTLSVAFYCYLRWRTGHTRTWLLAYVFFGWLAWLSHFSAIFCLACLAGFESFALLWNHKPRRLLAEWLLANLAIALVFCAVYPLWEPSLLAHRYYFAFFERYPKACDTMVAAMLSAPFMAASYLFPKFPLLLVLMGYALVPGTLSRRVALYPYLALLGAGCLFSMALYVFKLYGSLGGRQSLWMAPIIIPVTGAVIVDVFERILASKHMSHLVVACMLVGMTLLSDVKERSQNRSELGEWSPSQYREITEFLQSFGPRDLIDAARIDVSLFANPYPYMSYDVSGAPDMAGIIPYHNTRFLFDPFYAIDFSTGLMLATLQEAQSHHALDDVDRLVFMEQGWHTTAIDLSLCKALRKEIIAFPPLPPGVEPNRESLKARVVFLLVPKDVVVNDILALNGKARSCLDTKHDMIPDLVRPITPGAL